MNYALTLRRVYKRFDRQLILEGVDCQVSAGESFGLIGINGAGKTTLLKAVLDQVPIDGGQIEIFGVTSRRPQARAPLAFLPERFIPPPFLTGRDFMKYMARLHRVGCSPESLAELLPSVDLDLSALDKPARLYSKGMAQKLGLAATFQSRKALFLLDEPLSGLDPKARAVLKNHLNSLRSMGQSLFFSTHLLADVDDLCDRIGILHGGVLRFAGSPQACCERFDASNLEQAFLRCIAG